MRSLLCIIMLLVVSGCSFSGFSAEELLDARPNVCCKTTPQRLYIKLNSLDIY